MKLRSLLGLSLLVTASVATVPVFATVTDQRIFDAVNAYDNATNLPGAPRGFALTGVLRGQAQEQTQVFTFFPDWAGADGASCERLALLTLRNAGHFSFVVELEGSFVIGCRVERR